MKLRMLRLSVVLLAVAGSFLSAALPLKAAATALQQGEERAAADPGFSREAYFPGPGLDWEHRRPGDVGMDSAALAGAVRFAIENESPFGHDLRAYLSERLASGLYGEIVGPVKDRGAPNGLILRDGYIVAEWGDTERVDMTFSITKSYLSTTAGLAWDDGLIRDLEDPVAGYLAAGQGSELFETPHNAPITWHQLLTQTSEWEGTLWDKPDVADRRRGQDR